MPTPRFPSPGSGQPGLRRSSFRHLRIGDFRLAADHDSLFRGAELLPLEPRPVQVLRYLLEHRHRVVTKAELLDRVWHDRITTEAVVKQAVAQIRRVLGCDPRDPRFVATYHRRGYRYVGPVGAALVRPDRPCSGVPRRRRRLDCPSQHSNWRHP